MSSKKLQIIGILALLFIMCAGAAFAAAPTVVSVVRQDPAQALTNAAQVTWRVTFDQPVQGADPADFTVTPSNGPISGFSVDSATAVGGGAPMPQWDVVVNTGTGDGEIRLDVNEGATIENVDLELLSAGFAEGETYVIDKTGTGVTIDRADGQPDPTVSDKIRFKVSFGEPVTGFNGGDVTLSGSANPSVCNVFLIDGKTVPGSGLYYSDYIAEVSVMADSGRVIIAVEAGKATEAAGNGNTASTTAPAVQKEFYGHDTVTYGIVPHITRVSPAQTNCAPPAPTRVTFNISLFPHEGLDYGVALVDDTANGFDVDDVVIKAYDAATGAEFSSVEYARMNRYLVEQAPLDKTRWNLEIDGIDRSCAIVASIPAGAFLNNNRENDGYRGNFGMSNNASTEAPPNLNYDMYTYAGSGAFAPRILCPATNWIWYDIDRPTVSVEKAQDQDDPTAAPDGVIRFLATFNEPMIGPDRFTAEDVVLSGTAGAGNVVLTEIQNQTSVTTMLGDTLPDAGVKDSRTYNVVVSGMTQKGTVIASIDPYKAQDGGTNWNIHSSSADNVVDYDPAPTCTINQAIGQADPTSGSPINFTVVFSKPVIGFIGSDLALSGTAGATTAVVSSEFPNDGTTFNVAVSGMTGVGTVIALVPVNKAKDADGNFNYQSTSVDNTVFYDNGPVTCTINQAVGQPDPTQGTPITFDVEFSKPVTGFEWVPGDTARQDVILGGTAGASKAVITAVGDRKYKVAISGMSQDGTVTPDVPAGVAFDASGNTNEAATFTDHSTHTVIYYDPLTVTVNQAVGQADPTKSAPILFTAVFNHVVEDFATGDVTLGGTAGATTATVTDSGDHMTYTVSVDGMSVSGTVTASIAAGVANRVFPTYTLPNKASTSDDNQVTYDNSVVGVTINQADTQADPTSGTPINFTVVFTEPVTGFATGDVTLSGTAGATTGTVTGSGATYNVAVSGMTQAGTVIAAIAGGKAQDDAGNFNQESTSTDNSVTYEVGTPTVTIDQASDQADPTTDPVIKFTAVFSKPVTGFSDSDVTLGGTAGAVGVGVADTGDQKTYTITVSGMTQAGTVTATIPANVAQDSVGNGNAASTSTDNEVTYRTPLTVTIAKADGQAAPATTQPILFTVVFSKPVDDFSGSVVTVAGTVPYSSKSILVTNSGDYKTYTVAVSGMSGPGSVIASVAANVSHDADGVGNSASNTATCQYEVSPHTVTINQAVGQADPTNVGPINFTVVFSSPVTGFSASGLVISGSAGGAKIATITGSGAVYNVAVEGMTTSGTVIADVAKNAAYDSEGIGNVASTSDDNVVGYDVTGPTVIINQAGTQADPAVGTPVNFTAVFSEAVKDFDAADIALMGTANPTTATIKEISPMDGTTYTVSVTAVGGEGSVIASIPAGVVTDIVGNPNVASTSTDNNVTLELIPSVTINQAFGQPDPTNALPINFTAVFSTPVLDFDGGDVTVTGTAGATTATVTDSGDHKTFTVAVPSVAGPGTVIATIAAGVAHSASGRASKASTSTDNTVTYDDVPLTVTIDQSVGQADPTKSSPISFTAVFSKPVDDFIGSDVTLTGTAGATTAVLTDSGDHKTFTVSVSGMTSEGTVIASIEAGVAHDAANNANEASTSTDNSVLFDNVVPAVTINQADTQVDPTTTLPIDFTVVFTEPVVDFTSASVTLVSSAGETLTCEVTSGGTTYNVAVSGVTYSSIITATIAANVAHDASGNGNAASTSTDNTVQFDDGLPLTVTVEQAEGQSDPTNLSPVNFTVTFSKPVTDFVGSSAVLSGTAGATTAVATDSGDQMTFNLAVSGMTSVGTVIASIPAGVVHDSVLEPNEASTSVDNVVVFDESATTVTINQAAGQLDPTAASPINFTVEFNKPVTGFTSADVSISGTAGGTKTATVTGSGATYNVAISGMTGTGTVIASIPAGAAQDSVGNANSESASTDNVVTFDFVAPTVTINQAAGQADPTNASPINFTVVFSEPVIDFGAAGVIFSGTAGGTKSATVTGSGSIYNVAVTGMTSVGTVIARLVSGAAQDLAGNPSSASTSTDNTVTFDDVAPSVTINQAVGQDDPTNESPVNFTVVFSEPVVDFAGDDVTIGGSVGGVKAATVTGSGTTYNVAVTGMDGAGTLIASIGAGVATDAAGNANLASTSSDNSVAFDNSQPSVTINQAVGQADPTSSPTINFTVVFSKSVSDFATGNVMLSGSAGASLAKVTGSGTTYNVAVTGMVTSGTVVAKIAAGVAHDSSGNPNLASTSTDNSVSYVIDTTAVAVTVNQAVGQADPTGVSPVNFTVVFSKPVVDFTSSAVLLTGTAGGTKTLTVTGSGTTYNLAVGGLTTTGTVIAAIAANTVHDAAGNGNTASTSTDNVVSFDVTGPTVAIIFPSTAASCARNTSALSMNGTATDTSGIASVAWSDETGHSGACTGTETWNVAGLTVHGVAETITVTATDKAGNTGSTTLRVTIVDAAPSGWTGMSMVSVPIIPDVKNPKTVVGFNGNSWWAFLPASNSYATYPDTRSFFDPLANTPGRGFWAFFVTPGAPVGTIPDQTKATSVSLATGWNLMGQPFVTPVDWDLDAITVRSAGGVKTLRAASAAGWVTAYAWGWHPDSSAAGGSYYLVYDPSLIPTAVGQMSAWQGYWMRATVNCEIIFPGLPVGLTGEAQ